ncbi:cytochrome c oxidase subunit 4 [Streptomyces sp. NPDC006283]|uniref:aa3-type cytochrome oxidase subunit IV n=1 Tax=Streptomyces sp. NPDC006283 TaxID=3156741 RepID=UPI0033A9DD6E
MKPEALLFLGVAVFFAASAMIYGWWAGDPTGTAVLVVSFLMAALVTFFLGRQDRRLGTVPQNRGQAEVRDTAGPVAFFPPRSYYPVLAAVGTAVLALGVVYGLWLFLIGAGLLAPAVFGFVFQYNDPEP